MGNLLDCLNGDRKERNRRERARNPSACCHFSTPQRPPPSPIILPQAPHQQQSTSQWLHEHQSPLPAGHRSKLSSPEESNGNVDARPSHHTKTCESPLTPLPSPPGEQKQFGVVRRLFTDGDDDDEPGATPLSSTPDTPSNSQHAAVINVNSADVPQLCALGLSREQAEAVVSHRVKNGKFRNKDDVRKADRLVDEEVWLKVLPKISLASAPHKKITTKKLPQKSYHKKVTSQHSREVKDEVEVEDLKVAPSSGGKRRGCKASGRRRTEEPIRLSSPIHKFWSGTEESPEEQQARKPKSTPPTFPSSSLVSELASAPSTLLQQHIPHGTPPVRSPGGGGKSGSSELRVATWNLECFNKRKVENLAVVEVICYTILSHGFDIIALQEIGDETALHKIREELNKPTLEKIQKMGSNKRQWELHISLTTGRMFMGMERNGFLWNSYSGVNLEAFLLDESGLFLRKPFAGRFEVRDWRFIIVSVHLRAKRSGKKYAGMVEEEVRNLYYLVNPPRDLDVILVGDFNMPPDSPHFDLLRGSSFVNIFGPDKHTNISSSNLDGTKCYDNIWISAGIQTAGRFGGVHAVVRRNLQHSSIKNYKSPDSTPKEGATVSDHCPIFAGFRA